MVRIETSSERNQDDWDYFSRILDWIFPADYSRISICTSFFKLIMVSILSPLDQNSIELGRNVDNQDGDSTLRQNIMLASQQLSLVTPKS